MRPRGRSERRALRTLLSDVDAVIYETDATGRFTFVSAGAESLLGHPTAAWLETADFRAAHVHADDRVAVLGAIRAAATDGRPHDLEYRMLHRDGSPVWVRDIGRVAPDDHGRVTRGVIVDVSRQKLEEERHSGIELRFQRLIEQLPAIVYTESVTEDAAGVIYVSPQIRRVLGIDPEEWIGSSAGWLARVHQDDRARVEEANARSDATGETFAAEYRMIAADGRSVWVHDESVLVRDDEGRPLFWQGVMVDITEQRRAAELEDALSRERAHAQELRALDEVKNTFLQAVSHDLRTPLAAILGLAVTLEREDIALPPEEAREMASRIAANARKLDRIVNDLLDLDRIGRGIVEPNLVATDVGDLVGRIVAESDLTRHRQVSIDAPPVTAEVDPPKVERIVENLLANTARHTPDSARVWVRVREEDVGVVIVVEDDGPGVPPELRDSVFEPFRRGDGRSHSPGVGIGLALVARFAELHGGRSWVQEREGGGASFRVWLPAHGPSAGQPTSASSPSRSAARKE